MEEARKLPKDTPYGNDSLLVAQKLKQQLKETCVVDEKLEEIEEMINSLLDSIQYQFQYTVSVEDRQLMGLYHLLLWRTAGKERWTHMRSRKELRVVPYLPKLLELTRMTMEATLAENAENAEKR